MDVNKEIAKGSLWMIFMRFSIKGIGLVSTVILARLLLPEDFGVVAISMSIFAFIKLMCDTGFGTALIQKQNASADLYNTAWTLNVILGTTASVILIVVSFFADDYFEDSRLTPILQVLALVSFIASFGNIGIVNFRKEMNFKKDFQYNVLAKVINFSITMIAAFSLKNYWALLIGMLSNSFINVFLSYRMHPYRPSISIRSWRELLGFSIWLQINNVLFFINNKSQNLILGKFSEAEEVGFYTVADEVATLPSVELVAPINRAAYPGYSRVSSNISELRKSYSSVFSTILLVAIPSSVGIAMTAPYLIPLLLGDKWTSSVLLIQIISLTSVLVVMNTNSGYVYLALGKQRITTMLMISRTIVFVSLLMYLVPEHKALGVAWSMALATIILFPANQWILAKSINLNFINWLFLINRPIVSSLAMAVVVYVVNQITLNNGFSDLVILLSMVFSGFFAFCISLYFLWILGGRPSGVESLIFSNIFHPGNILKGIR
ncbi:lipopolysaccharide biosynthesis protein [Aestuariicella sp. G3-2]|uniref:lipopolysaccharide biosynthesis protein n=1 Tax=Pseudomaricurvus albidus TaxID=2842452 RepID=UPI001C0B4B02|nr:lipopolysaccharide biosynthesis protein [Aestuariicella albida]MBU3070886.1 lipopolysaccharide biosynthesis protein [Aestuariicella albida]